MNKDSKIYIAGHNGMVGSAVHRKLVAEGYSNIIFRSSSELDLKRQQDVELFFEENKPEYVFLCAAKVGGIMANNIYRADFIYDNLQIELNVIYSAYKYSSKKLMFFGSSCIYPKFAPQPLKEDSLLTGILEPTNEPYAIAKISGIKLCEAFFDQYDCNFISVMPTNLYGYNDNYHPQNAHVLPALIRKFHEAKVNNLPTVEIWGSGKPKREFLFVDDLADAAFFLMKNYNEKQFINIGCGEDISIGELANTIQDIVDYKCEIKFDTSKPDGTPRKLMDVSKLTSLGWRPKINLVEGIAITYKDLLSKNILTT